MLILTLLSVWWFSSVNSAQILAILQYPFYSHQLLHHVLLKELAARGHNLTIFTSHKFDYGNLTNVVQHHFSDSAFIHENRVDVVKFKQENVKWYQQIIDYEGEAFYETTTSEMEHPEIQKIIHESQNYKFDLIIGECFYCSLLYLAEVFDCPIVYSTAIDTTLINGLMGNDINPAQYPDSVLLPYLHRRLTFIERIESLLVYGFYVAYFLLNIKPRTQQFQSKYFHHTEMSVVEILQRRSALYLSNTNVAFGHARPLTPNTIRVGFMHVEPPEPIKDENLLKFLDDSFNGVIIVSFGSYIDTARLHPATIRKFLRAFEKSKFNVIWNSRTRNVTVPANVLLLEWLPLADAFAHPNVKLLIFHGGLASAYEAIDREVPMIVFPLVNDQGSNARMLVHNRVAKELDFNAFTESELLTAIEEMTKEKYKTNIKKLRQRAYDELILPRELAVWHIERVLRNKNDFKVFTAGFTEQIQRFLLDIIASALVLAVGLRWLIGKFIKKYHF